MASSSRTIVTELNDLIRPDLRPAVERVKKAAIPPQASSWPRRRATQLSAAPDGGAPQAMTGLIGYRVAHLRGP
jgi:hypothetical protein